MAERYALTFFEEFVLAEESFPGSGVVGLEYEFDPAVDGNEGPRNLSAAQAILQVLHLVNVYREYVNVIEQTAAIQCNSQQIIRCNVVQWKQCHSELSVGTPRSAV